MDCLSVEEKKRRKFDSTKNYNLQTVSNFDFESYGGILKK